MDKLHVTLLTHDDNSDVHPRKTLPESANLALSEEPTNPPLSTKSTLSWAGFRQFVSVSDNVSFNSTPKFWSPSCNCPPCKILVTVSLYLLLSSVAAIILISFRCHYTTTWWLRLDQGGHLCGNSWIIQAPSALQCVKLSDALRIRTWQNISHLIFVQLLWTESAKKCTAIIW